MELPTQRARKEIDGSPLLIPHSAVQQVEGKEGRDKFGQIESVILMRKLMEAFPASDPPVSHALLAASPQLRYVFEATVPWSLPRCGRKGGTILPCIEKEVVNLSTMQVEPQHNLMLHFPEPYEEPKDEDSSQDDSDSPERRRAMNGELDDGILKETARLYRLHGSNRRLVILSGNQGLGLLNGRGGSGRPGTKLNRIAPFVIKLSCASKTAVSDRWLYHLDYLTTLECFQCPSLATVRNSWIAHCSNLVSASFCACRVLETVGDSWMSHCDKLTMVDFTGLSSLQTVGSYWLHECPSLTSVNFSACTSLRAIGDRCLSECHKLASVDFSGCTALASVGRGWLHQCPQLTSVNFSGCSSLQTVGNHWLGSCDSLQQVDFNGCVALHTVGENWLNACLGLTSVDVSGCTALTVVGQGWLRGCHPRIKLSSDALKKYLPHIALADDGLEE